MARRKCNGVDQQAAACSQRPIALSPSMAGWAEAYPKVAASQAAMIPLRRFGDCDADVAPVAVFLASDEARYLTAVTLPVDGGGSKER